MKKILLISLFLYSTNSFALADEDKSILSQSKEKITQGAKTVIDDFKKDDNLKNAIKESYQHKKEKLIEKKDSIKSNLEGLKDSPFKQKLLKEYFLHKLQQKDQK